MAAQALAAAVRTVEAERRVHSLHAYFILVGRSDHPIVYTVERLRDGGSFTTRRVTAVQFGEVIFMSSVSFKKPELGVSHQWPAPDALAQPPPASSASASGGGLLEVRRATGDSDGTEGQDAWVRVVERLPDDPTLHVCALTYLSDLTLATTAAAAASSGDAQLDLASLDHAMWFHRPFRADEWLLFSQRSPSSNDGRGLAMGSFFARDGDLVATAVQEALLRTRRAEG